ncbi:MAG: hypothetical protein A2731_00820 [Candidatus Buchananbacteria bacterium RIFCSPHIGHO2_01_FULL_39_8]|uniref:CxxC-x17-CxxC domain-containing protein n=1 Tax=Candidatus Buchananbacteria bacterium RIFCSPHIGHO2_01_FULL_39_8 TaxID=1797533 RepID=A0A1G1Y0D9_9BACT|nr:MAG: hypothetical protein A2731_00820 [Candidatus Buchananbacteria bacterium RIFCSPHIGHO2_01_FULL_39_8]
MKIFDKKNKSGGPKGNSWSKRRDFGNSKSSRPGMHQAICSECGKVCEVPFRPTGDRPVFCSVCFEKHGKDSRQSGPKNYGRPRFEDKKMYEAVCSKCGKVCEVPFRPTGEKPVYCSDCFSKSKSTSSKSPDQFRQQFEALNNKLDQILKALSPSVSSEVVKEVKKSKKAATKKAKTKKSSKSEKKSAKGGSASGGK